MQQYGWKQRRIFSLCLHYDHMKDSRQRILWEFIPSSWWTEQEWDQTHWEGKEIHLLKTIKSTSPGQRDGEKAHSYPEDKGKGSLCPKFLDWLAPHANEELKDLSYQKLTCLHSRYKLSFHKPPWLSPAADKELKKSLSGWLFEQCQIQMKDWK